MNEKARLDTRVLFLTDSLALKQTKKTNENFRFRFPFQHFRAKKQFRNLLMSFNEFSSSSQFNFEYSISLKAIQNFALFSIMIIQKSVFSYFIKIYRVPENCFKSKISCWFSCPETYKRNEEACQHEKCSISGSGVHKMAFRKLGLFVRHCNTLSAVCYSQTVLILVKKLVGKIPFNISKFKLESFCPERKKQNEWMKKLGLSCSVSGVSARTKQVQNCADVIWRVLQLSSISLI